MDVLLVSAVPVTTFLDLLFKPIWGAWLMLAVLLVFVLRERASIGRAVLRSCAALGLITVVLLPTLQAPTLALEQGIRIGGLIGSLLIAVNLLSRSVGRHRRAREVLNRLYQLPAGSRYLGLSIASQFFAGLLGLAGVAMMMEAASAQESGEEQRMAHFSAVTRGYSGVSLWSPMYSNMGIVLSLSGGTTWTQVLPVAVLVSGLFIGLGALLDSLQQYERSPGAGAKALQIWRAGWPVALGMIAFLSVIVIASHKAHLAVSAVIIAAAPLVAMLFNFSQRGDEIGSAKAVLQQMATDALTQYCSFR